MNHFLSGLLLEDSGSDLLTSCGPNTTNSFLFRTFRPGGGRGRFAAAERSALRHPPPPPPPHFHVSNAGGWTEADGGLMSSGGHSPPTPAPPSFPPRRPVSLPGKEGIKATECNHCLLSAGEEDGEEPDGAAAAAAAYLPCQRY